MSNRVIINRIIERHVVSNQRNQEDPRKCRECNEILSGMRRLLLRRKQNKPRGKEMVWISS